jgi:hypothetical protein
MLYFNHTQTRKGKNMMCSCREPSRIIGCDYCWPDGGKKGKGKNKRICGVCSKYHGVKGKVIRGTESYRCKLHKDLTIT